MDPTKTKTCGRSSHQWLKSESVHLYRMAITLGAKTANEKFQFRYDDDDDRCG